MSDTAIEALRYSEFPNSSDCISRQAAIDAIDKALSRTFIEPCGEMILKDLPSAQPEIIRCKDCRYSVDEYDDGDCYCKRSCSWHGANWDFYCAAAERREE